MREEAHAGGGWVGEPGGLVSRALALEAKSDPSSTRPANAVTTPMPVTPPRAYGLSRNASRRGVLSAMRLWSHAVDHGATTRMNPASRKYAANRRRLNVLMISLRPGRGSAARRGRRRRGSHQRPPAV